MSANEQHLAQFNVARMLAPIDDPVMEGFRSQLDRINALADQSPGFVWRLQTEGVTPHHRGQMTVYLRLLGAPVPAIYGPSADDTSFG